MDCVFIYCIFLRKFLPHLWDILHIFKSKSLSGRKLRKTKIGNIEIKHSRLPWMPQVQQGAPWVSEKEHCEILSSQRN